MNTFLRYIMTKVYDINTMMFLMCYIIDDMVLLLNICDEVVILDDVMPSYYILCCGNNVIYWLYSNDYEDDLQVVQVVYVDLVLMIWQDHDFIQ